MKKYIIATFSFYLILMLVSNVGNAQVGLNFQGVARKSDNTIIASQIIKVKLSILQGAANGELEYNEVRSVITNAQGLFTLVIGDTGALSTLGNFNNINWKNAPKFLKIEIDPTGGENYITMGTTQFQYVAYAKFASSVDAENIIGTIPVGAGGTGVKSLLDFKKALQLDKVNNTADMAKPISSITQAALDSKLGLNDILNYTKKAYVDSVNLTKLNIVDTSFMLSNRFGRDTISLSNRINSKQNSIDTAAMLSSYNERINSLGTNVSTNTASITRNTSSIIANTASITGEITRATNAENTLSANINSNSASITSNTSAIIANTASITSIINTPITYASLTGTVPTWNQNTTGNAATATIAGTASTSSKLITPKNINGVAFDGTADITVTADAGTVTGTTLKSTVTGSSLTSVGTLTSLEVNGRATNSTAFNATTASTIDFTKSNLAYSSNSPSAFTLSGLKDGGTFTLAVQGTTAGTASFTAGGFTFLSVNNGVTTSGKHTLYTFIVMGTFVYYFMTAGF